MADKENNFWITSITTTDSIKSHAKLVAKRRDDETFSVFVFTQQDKLRVIGHTIGSLEAVRQVIIEQNLRTLHLSLENNGQDLDEETSFFIVAIDPNQALHAIKIKLNQNADVYATIETHFQTKPIEFAAFDRELPHIVRSSRNWDLWLFSTTNSTMFFDEEFTFQQSVGFIMSTQRNRLTQFWEHGSTNFTQTYEDSDVFFSQSIHLLFFNDEQKSETELLAEKFQRKNDWIHEQNACRPDLGIKDVDSICYVHDIFQQPAALSLDFKTPSKLVPRQSSSCNQEEKLLYYLYEEMKLGQKAMRNVCFPKELEYLSAPNPPVTKEGKAMVNVDKENFQLFWINKASRELDKQVWLVKILEEDDFDVFDDIKGFSIQAKYQVVRISHINVDFEISKPLQFSFFPKDQAYDFHVSVNCWSLQCPSFIKQNENSMYSEIIDESVVNGTFVYFVETTQLSQANVTKYTVSFTFTQKQTSIKSTVGINITDDFETWYAANRKNLLYYAPKISKESTLNTAMPSSQQKSNSQEADGAQASNDAGKSDLQGQLDPKTFQFVNEWSSEDILLAIQEAKKRLTQKYTVNIPKLTLSSTGVLTVSFVSDIQLPSYLKKELDALIDYDQVKKPPLDKKRYRSLGLFKVSTFESEIQTDTSEVETILATLAQKYFLTQGCDLTMTETCYINFGYFFCIEQENPNLDQCGTPTCNPKTDSNCKLSFECNPAWNPECLCGEPIEIEGVLTGRYQEPKCKEIIYYKWCTKGKCKKDYCDPTTDKTCYINYNCEESINSVCTYYNRCDPLTDPSCSNSNCDSKIDKDCKKPVLEVDCDSNNPNCYKYVKPVDEPVLQELPKVAICDQSDPKSDCYKPPEIVAQTPCFETQYFDEQTERCVYYQIYFGSFDQLFKVEALSRDQEGRFSEQGTQSLKFTKQIVSATNREIVIQLEFSNVIDETHNEFIRVTTNFASFNLGITISESEIAIPKDVFKPTNRALGKISEASKSVVVTAAIGTAVMRTSMQASLSQLWGMINGIQFIIHIPCINLDFPTNSFTVLKQLIAVATFELPSVNLQALKGKWKVENKEVLTDLPKNVISSMDQLGYNDANISSTMGTGYLIILGVIIGLLTILVTLPCLRFQFCSRLNQWLRKQLLWNFIIRLMLEQSLEITYSIVLTFKYGSFSATAFGTAIDYIIAALLALSVGSLPVFMTIFYLRNYGNWESEEFEETYGAPLKGLKKTQKSSLVYPVYFVLRRAIFCFTTLFLYDSVVIQLYIHHLLTMGSIAYLVSYVPQEESLEYRLELMNEYFTVFAIDLCFLFTDLDSNRIRQYNWGYVLIVTILICVGVHVIFLFRNMITIFIKTVKKVRKKGWMKTFPSLKRVQHILRVLTCRNKFDISRLKEKQESSDESDQKKSDKPSQISEAEQSVNEDEEAPANQPQLLRNPANDEMTNNNNQPTLLQSPASNQTPRSQSSFCQNVVSDSLHQARDRFDGCFEVKTVGQLPAKRDHRHVIEDEDLVQANKSQNSEERNYFDLNSKCDYIANEILSSNDVASVDNVQDIEDGPYNPSNGRLHKSSAVATLNELRPQLLRSLERSDATMGLEVTVNKVDTEVEAQVSSAILFERMKNLQVNPDVRE